MFLVDGSWISYLGGTEEDHILFDYMRLNSMKHILPLVLLLLLQPHPSHSHNGAVAIAVPVEGITVDGDLSDWPEGMREYDIELYESGDAPRDSSDFQGSFRVGFNEEENALYVAVEVIDESAVIDSTEMVFRNEDGCEVYLDIRHEEGKVLSMSFFAYGDIFASDSDSSKGLLDFTVMRKQDMGNAQYEWMIKIGSIQNRRIDIKSGEIIGLDVAVSDKDEDGSYTWMTWGRGRLKGRQIGSRGDLLLLPSETFSEKALALIGKIVGSSDPDALKTIGYQMLFAGLALAFAILHLFLFLYYSKSIENLYFSISLGGIGFLSLSQLLLTGEEALKEQIYEPLSAVVMPLILISGMLFLYTLFYRKIPKLFWGFVVTYSDPE